MGVISIANRHYRNNNINLNSNEFLKKISRLEKLYNMREKFGVYNKTKFNQTRAELFFHAKRMVGNKPGNTFNTRVQRALNYIARRKALRNIKKGEEPRHISQYFNKTNNLNLFRKKSLAQMYGPAKRIQNAFRGYRYRTTGIQPSKFHSAARKIQGAWRRRNLRVPRNRINNVMMLPLNSKYVVQFKEGQTQRLVTPNTMKHMRKPNGSFVSALSKVPIKNFRLRKVQYYGNEMNKNKNLDKKIKNASKKQNNLRKGKNLLRPIIHMSQVNQNAQLARSLYNDERRAIQGSAQVPREESQRRRHRRRRRPLGTVV